MPEPAILFEPMDELIDMFAFDAARFDIDFDDEDEPAPRDLFDEALAFRCYAL